MSDSSKKWQSVIDVIIPHPSAPCALLLVKGGAWYLPRVRIQDRWANGRGQISHALHQQIGLATTVLRCTSKRSDDEQRTMYETYVLENRDRSWKPPAHARWVGRAELDELAHPEQRTVLEAYLVEVESGVIPELRAPWCRVGWLDQATTWIETELAALGMPLIGSVEQVKNWSISCILRANTTAGIVYFKQAAALPLFVNEPVVMAALARRYPDNVPMPLSLDPQRRWMLLPDFGQQIGRDRSISAHKEMLRIFGAIQRDCVAAIDYLLAVGCHDRQLDRLPAQARALANDQAALIGLTEAEIAQFLAVLPRLEAMCEDLAAYGVPQTLAHGDLHLNNVAVSGEHYLFFDWTDTCITHPFLDLISVFYEQDQTIQAQLRDVYLAGWSDYAPMERLLEAWELAQVLSDLHQAISYQHILVGLEPSAQIDFKGAVPLYLRKVLQALS